MHVSINTDFIVQVVVVRVVNMIIKKKRSCVCVGVNYLFLSSL